MSNGATKVTDIRFSVIIPAYNAEKTITRALESVIAQSYTPFQIIVVDDASTDKTGQLVKDIFSAHLALSTMYIKVTQNSGSSIARNTAMNLAGGDYIAFLDADDTWHSDKLMIMNIIISAHPGLSIIWHPFTQDDIVNKHFPGYPQVHQLPFYKLIPRNLIATSCAIIKNEPSFRFDPAMRYTEDFDLWLRIGYKKKIWYIDEPLTRIYRGFTTKGGISEHKWEMRKGEMKAYIKLIQLNPAFILLIPFLLLFSIVKHISRYVQGR